MSFCLPREYAIELQNVIKSEGLDVDKLASLSTAERKAKLSTAMKAAARKRKDIISPAREGVVGKIKDKLTPAYSNEEIDTLVDKFNKGFEERIITSSRDFMKKQKEVAALQKQLEEGKGVLSQSEILDMNTQIIALEEKIAAHQRKLLQGFLDRELNRLPKARRNSIVDKVKNVRHMLTPNEKQVFLEDLITHKLGFGIDLDQAAELARLSDESDKALSAASMTHTKVTTQAKQSFLSRPDVTARLKELQNIPDQTERTLRKLQIDKEAEQFGDLVWDGKLLPDGTPVSKVKDKEQFASLIKARVEQGMKTQQMLNYVGTMERSLKRSDIKTVMEATGSTKVGAAWKLSTQSLVDVLGASKSVVASVDFSWLFRQGWQVALTHPKMFFTNMVDTTRGMGRVAVKSKRIADSKTRLGKSLDKLKITQQLDNTEYDLVKAEIMTRSNALKGKYQAANNGYGLSVFQEEAFPNSFPERMPFALGRTFKMSEYGFNTMALRMRADLADTLIHELERKGVNMMDKEMADELGLFVGALTGRGRPFGLKMLEGNPELSNTLNATFFSPRFVGSQIYTFTAVPKWLGDTANPVKKLAAKNTGEAFLKAAVLMGLFHTTAKVLGTGEVDYKLDSPTFGHLVLGNLAFDMTGSHSSIITLAGKIWNLQDQKRWDNKLGIYVDTPWTASGVQAMTEFILNKTSPGASVMKDFINGYGFGQEEITFTSVAKSLLVPLTIQNTVEATQKGGYDEGIYVLVAEMVGVGVREMKIQPLSKDWKALKSVSNKGYNEAVSEMNTILQKEVARLRKDKEFQNMPEEEQFKEIERVARKMKADTVDKYSDKYGVPDSE